MHFSVKFGPLLETICSSVIEKSMLLCILGSMAWHLIRNLNRKLLQRTRIPRKDKKVGKKLKATRKEDDGI